MKQLIQTLDEQHKLYRDPATGIAWVEDTSAGVAHSAHPNISTTGSIRGMKQCGYWGKKDRVVRSHGWYFNIDHSVQTDAYDTLAAQACQCGGQHA